MYMLNEMMRVYKYKNDYKKYRRNSQNKTDIFGIF